MGCLAVYEREMRLMGKKIGKFGYVFSAFLFPLIYLFSFGWGLGDSIDVEGGYLPFLAKGMLAITVLLNSFQQSALSVSVGRFYFHTLQTVLLSPVSALETAAGIALAAATRGLLAGFAVYAVAYFAFDVPPLSYGGVLGVVLSALCFGALGIAAGLLVDSPDALSLLVNCVIMPMTFFCGSFFPLTRLPPEAREAISLLPLSLSNRLLRADTWSEDAICAACLLAITTLLSFGLGVWKLKTYSE